MIITAILIFVLWVIFTLFQYWICVNSCAKAYEYDKKTTKFGINNFNIIKDCGLFWCLLPILGFILTYSFITENGKIRWDSMTVKYIKNAWSSPKIYSNKNRK